MHALQVSLDRFGFSVPGGRFDINRECEKIEIKMQLLALIITALFVDNWIRPFLPTTMFNQSIGPNMRFSLLRNASFGIALTLVFSLEVAQAQLAGLGGASEVGDFRHVLDPRGLQQAGLGYAGIVVAALGRYNPFSVVLVAFLLGGLANAGYSLQGPGFPAGLVGVLQGMILFFALGGELLIHYRISIQRSPSSLGTRA